MIEVRHTRGDAELQKSYNKIFASKSIAQYWIAYRWILDILKPKPGSRMLDVACGEGPLLVQAVERDVEAFGVDFSSVAISIARTDVPSGRFGISNGAYLPFADNSFDIVSNIGSLEHYERIDLGSQEMARVLKPTGTAVIQVPNMFGMLWNVQYVKHTGDVCDDGQPLQRYATPGEWRRLLERNGFVVEKMLPFGWAWPKTWREFMYYMRRPKLWLNLLVWQPRHFPNLANNLTYICHKRL
jgi:SAM-dependent methyltransferase